MNVYYNEFDKKKCAALKQLMADGHITKGDIDDRSIRDVQPSDVSGYTRAHFFAGIGLWDHALSLSGWPLDRPVWTGSCPCQPYSSAGRQKAQADERHLWPEWYRLIAQCRPAVCFGEQVASSITKGWLDDVYQGLDAEGYAVGSAVLPAVSVGAPHRRDRLWFVADRYSELDNRSGHLWTGGRSESSDRPDTLADASGGRFGGAGEGEIQQPRGAEVIGRSGALGHANSTERRIGDRQPAREQPGLQQDEGCGFRSSTGVGPMADTDLTGSQGRRILSERSSELSPWSSGVEWIRCADEKSRLVKSGIRLLANGYPERVGLIHSAGDAIVAEVAAEFISAFMETTLDSTPTA